MKLIKNKIFILHEPVRLFLIFRTNHSEVESLFPFSQLLPNCLYVLIIPNSSQKLQILSPYHVESTHATSLGLTWHGTFYFVLFLSFYLWYKPTLAIFFFFWYFGSFLLYSSLIVLYFFFLLRFKHTSQELALKVQCDSELVYRILFRRYDNVGERGTVKSTYMVVV